MDNDANNQVILCKIANRAMDIANKKLELDQLYAEDFRGSASNSNQFVREEWITGEIALELRLNFASYVKTELFTAQTEAKNGADWYWCIQVGDLSIHAHVQAKRIQRSYFGQPDKDGIVELDTEQIEKLLDSAEVKKKVIPGLQTWIATYARFNATPPCRKNPASCDIHGCGLACEGVMRQPSIWIAKAADFAKYGRPRKTMRTAEIIQNSIRLDCFLPCIESSTIASGPVGPMVKNFALTPNLMSYESSIEAIRGDSALSDEFKGALQIKI
jgi:hypothetical protein